MKIITSFDVLTGVNVRFWAKLLDMRTGEAIKESVVHESTELAVDERVEDGESVAMLNEFYKKQCHVGCFYSPFHISTALLI